MLIFYEEIIYKSQELVWGCGIPDKFSHNNWWAHEYIPSSIWFKIKRHKWTTNIPMKGATHGDLLLPVH